MDLPPIRVVSICSGGGGLDLGLRLAIPDARTICYVENEATAIEVLVARMEEGLLDQAPLWTDLRSFDGKPWRGVVDILLGGYPCPPFSVSGKKRGKDDPRHLWSSVARVIGECQPELCFFENVANHLNIGFEEVSGELLGLGYQVEAGLFSAAEVGAPHLRKRLFVLGRRPVADPVGVGVGGGDQPGPEAEGEEARQREDWQEVADEPGDGGEDVGFPVFPPGPASGEWGRILKARPSLEPAVRDVADGVAGGMGRPVQTRRADQVRVLGNGVVPACAAVAFVSLLRQSEEGACAPSVQCGRGEDRRRTP